MWPSGSLAESWRSPAVDRRARRETVEQERSFAPWCARQFSVPVSQHGRQFALKCTQIRNLAIERLETPGHKGSNAVARSATGVANGKYLPNLGQRESNHQRALNDEDAIDGAFRVAAVSRRSAMHRGQQSQTLVVAQRRRADARGPCRIARTHYGHRGCAASESPVLCSLI